MSIKQEDADVTKDRQLCALRPAPDALKFNHIDQSSISSHEDSEALEDEYQALKALLLNLSKQCRLLDVSLRRAEQWQGEAAKLAEARLPVVRIGLFGGTGTGKSSLLNCLLDCDILEKRGGGEACTAFVTRVVWNDDPIIHGLVTFITRDDWKFEVETFLDVLRDGVANGVEDVVAYAKKEEPQIWAKLDVLYPSLSGVLQHGTTVEDILSLDQGLENCFGKTLDYYGEDAEDLAEALYLAVRRASQGDSADVFIDTEDQHPSFWPLVAEVEYRVDAEILRGVVLVDLPGVQDSNAARDQVALKYLGNLDHIFVVASAVRATDSNPFSGKLGPGIKQILNANGFNVSLVATQGDLCLLPTKSSLTDDAATRGVKENFWNLERQIKDCEKLRKQLEAQMKLNASALKKSGKKRGRSPSDNGAPTSAPSKRRAVPPLTERAGMGRASAPNRAQANGTSKDFEEQMKAQATRLDTLRSQQEQSRPLMLQFAAVERRQSILTAWPRRFVDAISAYTGERGERTLPAAFYTSAETHRMQSSDASGDAGIVSLQQHVCQLGRERRKVFLRSLTRDLEAHALSIRAFLDVTGRQSTGSDGDQELDDGIARLMVRWYSTSITKIEEGDHGIFSTALQAFESVCNQLEVDMIEALGHAFVSSLRAASQTASGSSLQTFNDLVSVIRWNTLIAFMRRDGVFHCNWNESMVARMKDDVLGVWTQTFNQLDLSQGDNARIQDLREGLSGVLSQVKQSAGQDATRTLLVSRVDDVIKVAGASAENAIKTAVDVAQAKLTRGQRDISRRMADKLQVELTEAYALARAVEPGTGVAQRTKDSFREKLQSGCSQVFENVAEKTIEDVQTLIREVCTDLRAALFRCAVSMESDISVLWARIEGGTGDEEPLLRRAASEAVTHVLDHVAKSPYHGPA
ncbi:unnamed protein product [Peniophora sp. CBMAI 1063]|nr:unnamed protein product [Peniophora sp. CBMAI 1063]